MRSTILIPSGYYHIYNRGVDRRTIFMNVNDYNHFFTGLNELNTDEIIVHRARKKLNTIDNQIKKPMVKIIAYCLMPNHFHLLLHQTDLNGIAKFMHKAQMAYTKYFNTKYERTGALFEGPFKAKRITDDSYLLQVSRYIHRNNLDLIPHTMLKKINTSAILLNEALLNYRWSSYRFYVTPNLICPIGLKNDIVMSQFSSVDEYQNFTLKNISSSGLHFVDTECRHSVSTKEKMA